ncbi:hypothetical protein SmJEL517_g01708 [Synchytrium microbalum]|uniref:J domain-containing protein n=1 Tax=Synchytrium microbalum TaxID=1806994 RepID=A0A507C8U3_9FUNG|nr:uncharacterized protein SmJEL517_g01708 [Synchytrium microbalum]TPX35941.1 hypothetical protein SmJEL517_g01708 [Synchytrium microbalum]
MASRPTEDEDIDYYGLLGIDITANSKAIAKSYRQVGPDDTRAAALFLALTKAYDVLSDQAKRAEYDVKHKGKLERLKRKEAMNAESRKMRDELEARERAAKKSRTTDAEAEAATKEEIDRLREAGLAKLRQHERSLADAAERAQKIAKESVVINTAPKADDTPDLKATLTVKWNPNTTTPTDDELTQVFEKYGNVEHVLLPSKKGRPAKTALVAFKDVGAAIQAISDTSLTSKYELSWASGQEPPEATTMRAAQQAQQASVKTAQRLLPPSSGAPAFAAGVSHSLTNGSVPRSKAVDSDFEDMVLAQMMGMKK